MPINQMHYVLGHLPVPERKCDVSSCGDVTEILGGLLSQTNRMSKDKRIHFGDMMNTALTYMTNGWKDLLNYRHDGRCDIDNTEARRKIRSLTIGRKNTLFLGSEEGVEVATTIP